MRMSDLLGSTVRDVAGRRLGDVHDVRLVQNGPILGSWGAALTVDALLIGPHAVGVRLGYGRSEVQGPWAVRVTFEAIHGVLDAIPWHSIAAIQPGTILVREHDHADDGPRDGRVLDAGLELLDRQILDPDGRMAGNVDDLTLSWREGAAPLRLRDPGRSRRPLTPIGRSPRTVDRCHPRTSAGSAPGRPRQHGVRDREPSSTKRSTSPWVMRTFRRTPSNRGSASGSWTGSLAPEVGGTRSSARGISPEILA